MGSRKIAEIPAEPESHPQISADKRSYEQAVFAAELGKALTIDLHGLDRTEAVRALDAEISREAAAGTEILKIIHGRGTGTLKETVHRHLERHPLVAYFRNAENPAEQNGVIYAALYDARMKKPSER